MPPRGTKEPTLNAAAVPEAVDSKATVSDATGSNATGSPAGEAVAPADRSLNLDKADVDFDETEEASANGEEESDDGGDDGSKEAAMGQGRRRFGTVWLTVAVVVGLLLGY